MDTSTFRTCVDVFDVWTSADNESVFDLMCDVCNQQHKGPFINNNVFWHQKSLWSGVGSIFNSTAAHYPTPSDLSNQLWWWRANLMFQNQIFRLGIFCKSQTQCVGCSDNQSQSRSYKSILNLCQLWLDALLLLSYCRNKCVDLVHMWTL